MEKLKKLTNKQTNKEDEHELKTCATSVLNFYQMIFQNESRD